MRFRIKAGGPAARFTFDRTQSPSRPRRLSSAPQTLITPMGAITVKPAAGRIF